MGFPHDTIDIPGAHPAIADELRRLYHHNDLSDQLIRGVGAINASTHDVPPGHLCATAWVMTPQRDHILLVQHKLLGWSAPGGHMYPFESTKDAALRELEEETGLSARDVTPAIEAPAIIHASDVPGDTPHRHWNVSWFFTAPRNVSLTNDHHARWWSCNDLPTGSPEIAPTDLTPTIAVFRSLPS